MHFEIAVACVGFAREQRFELAPRHFRLQPFQCGFGFTDRFFVLFGFAELDQRELIVELLLDAANGVELILERVAFAHHALGARLVAPQCGILGLFVQLGEAPFRGIDVKDASSAARATA